MPLLGKAEKSQLEELILQKLRAHYDEHGSGALLVDGARVVVTAQGAHIDAGESVDPLAAVPLKTLFTALCYIAPGSGTMPREALDTLATEAAGVAAAQINRIAAD